MQNKEGVQINATTKKETTKKAKSKPQASGKFCIVHFGKNKSETAVRDLTEYSYNRIKDVASFRQASLDKEVKLDNIVQNIPGEFDVTIHGSHRRCYQSFTNISRLKRKASAEGEEALDNNEACSAKRRRSETSTSSSILLPADKCLFCNKQWKKLNNKKHGLVKCVTETAEFSIKLAAERKQDVSFLSRIRDLDLVAREAHYHSICRREYTRDEDRHASTADSEASALYTAHKKAFDFICNYVEENIINLMTVERMTKLKERYLLYLLENNPEAHNDNYKTEKLKEKLKKHFGDRIRFWKPSSHSELIYSDNVSTGQAVGTAFELACSEESRIEEAAMIVRRHILESQRNSDRMPFPPTADWLLSEARQPPNLLQNFISHVVSGKSIDKQSAKSRRFISSCSQDICYSTTNGRWVMPKHVLLAATIHHLTGSAELVTLLSRFGHCQSYSRTVELETAICNSITATHSVLPPSISRDNNVVLHLCWDNFDLTEETPSGAGTTHTAHGIIIQELKEDAEIPSHELQQVNITHERTVQPIIKEPEPCFCKEKFEPDLSATIVMPEPQDFSYSNLSDFVWMYCRRGNMYGLQNVPSLAGWLSAISANEVPHSQSTVDYMAPVLFPITENSTVKHVLEVSQEASRSVGQEYTIVTFDLGVAMKAYPIVWQYPDKFGDVIIRIGAFHIICSIFGAIGKHMMGSGLEDVIVEAGICASGSLQKVMTGKHYNRALRVHKLVLEGLERQLFDVFQGELSDSDFLSKESANAINKLSGKPNPEDFQIVVNNQEVKDLFYKYERFKECIREGQNGKTAQYWMGYMDMVWMVLTFIKATKENDFDLHLSSLFDLCPLFFAHNRHNYARYVPAYLMLMMNLNESHPGAEELLRSNGFSVSRSDSPVSRNPVDITIEQTINRHAKSHGGIIGFSRNYAAYYRWCTTRHTRAKYAEATLSLADMISSETATHKEWRLSQMKASEAAVKKVIEAFTDFSNPFNLERKEDLYCISSGVLVTHEIADDILQAYRHGQKAMEAFIQDRFINKTSLFHDPIQRSKLKTFASLKRSQKVNSSQNKLVEVRAERNLFGQLTLLSMKSGIDLEMTLSYQLGPVPWSLATADGMPVKTNKAKLLHKLEEAIDTSGRPPSEEAIYVYDGNAILQSMTGIPTTFEEVAEKVFGFLSKTSTHVDFVTDTYLTNSIKSLERCRRGTAPKFLLAGPKTRAPRDWKLFLSNDENKTQLIDLICSEWQKPKYSKRLQGRELIFVNGETCLRLASCDGITTQISEVPELFSTQEEADTRIILHCLHIAQVYPSNPIFVRSPDTDVFLLLTKYSQQIAQQIYFDTGMSNKRRLLNINEVVSVNGQEFCSVLPAFHSFSGCDTTSAFVRRGKVAPLKLLQKHRKFISTFNDLGQNSEISSSTMEELEQFVCHMYGKPRYSSVNKLRYDLFTQKFQPKSGNLLTSVDGIDLSLLPPCKASLQMHIVRANYQALIWNQAHSQYQAIPSPVGHGWKLDEDGMLAIDWSRADIMPQELIDILADSQQENDNGTISNEEDEELTDDEVHVDNILDAIFEDSDDDDDYY